MLAERAGLESDGPNVPSKIDAPIVNTRGRIRLKDVDLVDVLIDMRLTMDQKKLLPFLLKLDSEWTLVGVGRVGSFHKRFTFMRVGAPQTFVDPLRLDENGKVLIDMRVLSAEGRSIVEDGKRAVQFPNHSKTPKNTTRPRRPR